MNIENEDSTYIKKIIENYENQINLHITFIKTESGSCEGDNYMSVVKRVKIRGKFLYNKKDYNKSIIIKRTIPSASRRKLFRCDEAFRNEIAAYNSIVPLLKKFSKNRLPYPNCIYAGTDKTGDVVILDDLVAMDYRMVDRLVGLNYQQCSLVMKELGNLHAISLAIKTCDKEKFYNARTKIEEIIYCPEAAEFYTHSLESSLNEVLSSLRHSNQNNCLTSTIKKIEKLSGKLYNIMYQHVIDGNDSWQVICHGDVWINNMMFKKNQQINNYESMKLIDLQAMRFGSPVLDILQFLYSCTERTLRQTYFNQLIDDYHSSLILSIELYLSDEHLNLIKNNFTIDNIKNEMNKKALYGLGVSMWLLPAITFHPDRIPDLNKIELSHFTSREQEKVMTQMQTDDYHRRIKDIVLEFDEMGFLENV